MIRASEIRLWFLCFLCKTLPKRLKFNEVDIYFLTFWHYKGTRTRWEICPKIIIKAPKRRWFCRSGVLTSEYWQSYPEFTFIYTEAVTQMCFSRKVFKEYLDSLQRNIHAKVWLQLYWNPTSACVFFYKYTTYLQQNAFFREHLRRTASVYRSKYRGKKI